MALADEIELADVAQELIAEFGRSVNLSPPGGTDVSATEPWKGKTARGTNIPILAVFQRLEKELVADTAIQVGDSLAIIDSKTLAGRAITVADRILDGARQWQIVAPVEVKPGNTSFAWFCQVRETG